jgi:hypothetical protein
MNASHETPCAVTQCDRRAECANAQPAVSAAPVTPSLIGEWCVDFVPRAPMPYETDPCTE